MTSPRETSVVVVLGAGGTALYMAEVVERTGCLCAGGFLDDDPKKAGETLCGLSVLGRISDWRSLPENYLFVTSLYAAKGTPRYRSLVDELDIPDSRWATVVDPTAVVSTTATIGPGTFIGPGCIVEPLVRLGRRCALLGNVYVAHHTRLGDYVVCANSASLAGGVSVGDATYIGANATLREYVTIGNNAVIGMGSVVVKDVADCVTVVGNPARVISR